MIGAGVLRRGRGVISRGRQCLLSQAAHEGAAAASSSGAACSSGAATTASSQLTIRSFLSVVHGEATSSAARGAASRVAPGGGVNGFGQRLFSTAGQGVRKHTGPPARLLPGGLTPLPPPSAAKVGCTQRSDELFSFCICRDPKGYSTWHLSAQLQ